MVTIGLLIHGDNHFIVQGPVPARGVALELVNHWSLIQIGATTPSHLQHWTILSQAFREHLSWAVITPGDGDISPAVDTLLAEMAGRGVAIHDFSGSLAGN
jgi:hypothetical protein